MLIEIVIENEFCPFSSTANLHYEKFSDGTIKCLKKEIPFKIPSTWTWVRLGFIGNWGAGATPNRAHSEYYGGDIPWLKTGDLNDDYITEIPETITELALKETSVKLNPVGSILIAMYGATIGKLGILTKQATTNQACCACCPVEGVYNKYLFYFLMSHKTKFINRGIGGAQPNISKEKIVATLMPLPPIDEQLRIVSSIESLFFNIERIVNEQLNISELVVKTKSKILDLAIRGKLVPQNPDDEPATMLLARIRREKEELIKAGKLKRDKRESVIFRGEDNSYYETIGSKTVNIKDELPYNIPSTWTWVRLGTIGNWGAGATPNRAHSEYYGGGIPWLKTGDLNDDYITEIPETITELALKETSVKLNPVGSILIAMYGATIGKLGILTKPATTNQACCACCPVEGVYNKYLFYFLMSHKSKFINCGIGGAQPNISKEKIVATLMPLPPINEQKAIVARIEKLGFLLNSINADIA